MGDTDSLHSWCEATIKDTNKCDDLKDTVTKDGLDLTQILQEEILKKTDTELQNDINEKRRLIVNLKNLIETRNYFTNERKLEELQKIERDVYYNMIFIGLLLGLAIFMGIALIFYFFVFRSK